MKFKNKKLFTVNHFWTSLSSATWLLKSFFHTSPNFSRPFSFVIYPFLSLPFLSSFTSSTHLPWTSLLLLFLLSMFIFLLSRLPLSSSYITLSLLSSFNINSQESPFDSSLLLFSSPSTPAFFFLFEALSSHLPCQTLIPPSLPLLFLSPFILSPSLFPLFLPGIPSSSLSLPHFLYSSVYFSPRLDKMKKKAAYYLCMNFFTSFWWVRNHSGVSWPW